MAIYPSRGRRRPQRLPNTLFPTRIYSTAPVILGQPAFVGPDQFLIDVGFPIGNSLRIPTPAELAEVCLFQTSLGPASFVNPDSATILVTPGVMQTLRLAFTVATDPLTETWVVYFRPAPSGGSCFPFYGAPHGAAVSSVQSGFPALAEQRGFPIVGTIV